MNDSIAHQQSKYDNVFVHFGNRLSSKLESQAHLIEDFDIFRFSSKLGKRFRALFFRKHVTNSYIDCWAFFKIQSVQFSTWKRSFENDEKPCSTHWFCGCSIQCCALFQLALEFRLFAAMKRRACFSFCLLVFFFQLFVNKCSVIHHTKILECPFRHIVSSQHL